MEAFQESKLSQEENVDPSWRALLASIAGQAWPWRGDYLMAVFDLAVCADESGIHDGAPLCIVAGYIASVKQWLRFDDRWEAVLRRHEVSDFHSKDFFAVNEKGERVGKYRRLESREEKASYGDWTDQQANDFLDGLLSAIDQSSIHPIGACVETAVFFSFTHGERRYFTGGLFDGERMKWLNSGAPSKPYFLVYDHCLAEAGQRTRAGLKTLFLFDQQKQFEGRAVQQFADSMLILSKRDDGVGKRFAGVLFTERHEAPGLQAADLYTHCWYRHIAAPNKVGPRYKALDRLTVKVPGMKYYSQEHLSGLFRDMPPHIREAVRTWPETD